MTHATTRRRRGMTLLIVVLCLFVLTTLLGAMIRHLQLSSRQAKIVGHRAQAMWIAESAIERAVAVLSVDNEYSSEVWRATVNPAIDRDARVDINVVDAGVGNTREVSVVVEFPADSPFAARFAKTVLVDTNRNSED